VAMVSTVVFVILFLATLGVHLGNYCLRQLKDWRAKGLLILGCILAMGLAAQYYINLEYTTRVLALLAWRRLDEDQCRIISDGLKEPKIDNLQVAALAGDPEANSFAKDILSATKKAGYDIRMGQIVSSTPYIGLSISGPPQEVARLVALFAQAGFPDVKRQETGPGPVSIGVGSKAPPKSN
jgi:hypothetical protein